jgi:hypothetical protein
LDSQESGGGRGRRRDRVQPRRTAAGLRAGHHLRARRGKNPATRQPCLSNGHMYLLTHAAREPCVPRTCRQVTVSAEPLYDTSIRCGCRRWLRRWAAPCRCWWTAGHGRVQGAGARREGGHGELKIADELTHGMEWNP